MFKQFGHNVKYSEKKKKGGEAEQKEHRGQR